MLKAAFSLRKRRLAAEMRAACDAAMLRARALAASEFGERGAPVRRGAEEEGVALLVEERDPPFGVKRTSPGTRCLDALPEEGVVVIKGVRSTGGRLELTMRGRKVGCEVGAKDIKSRINIKRAYLWICAEVVKRPCLLDGVMRGLGVPTDPGFAVSIT